MLQPKKSKYRKQFRGKNKGVALRGNELAFGEFGLKALTGGWLSSNEIEAARKKITYATKRLGKYWIKVFPSKPITKKPVGVKMGSGKGAIETYVAVIKPGTILFEVSGVTEEMAKEALTKAGHKVSLKTIIVKK
ncbi:MAG: 50S ribosomal protein L16 [Candidatus Pacebacteria bacterium CG10_big_fil_rev_8_21_14_0_10_36_11]|nr:50S ribosomal protein L16 [Candidatus Pacearchaeota archaeon]OIP73696.1 MAG: 50S ribosomal protein L16 [Candidatus Pacebacteria bacterium CG2_30_36_39]PIR64719.1 MAG: 50S ribosomal protein L16 [Candidatus Pacebacteria bacterium CG10_big_fil_rev_8_21_14_0_10_36_11]PJC42342.1 MAG: 50S ribosomal protein L16 [Candidatus Pacebacteria bacterium CG_4_9_14_0_2_um_filter_36_8]